MIKKIILLFLLLAKLQITFGQLKALPVTYSNIKLYDANDYTTNNPNFKDKRIALVVGVSNYENIDTLSNDANDVDSITNDLIHLNFDVVEVNDADIKSFQEGINVFTQYLKSHSYDVSLFFYSGHGAQFQNMNYLIPKDFEIWNSKSTVEEQVKYCDTNCIRLDNVMGSIDDAGATLKYKFSFIDACRSEISKNLNNSILKESFDASKIKERLGNWVMYATTSGISSSDGQNVLLPNKKIVNLSNSVFTHCLLKYIRTKGQNFADFVTEVYNYSVDTFRQIPFDAGLTTTNFYFYPQNNGDYEDSKSVKVGYQIWAKENLDVSRFSNGESIPEAKTEEEWEEAARKGNPTWCYYNNDSTNGKKYGKLYNWYAVNDPRGLAPKGWHIPTIKEWHILIDTLGGEFKAGPHLKDRNGWKNESPFLNDDKSNLAIIPGGMRESEIEKCKFYGITTTACFWTISEDTKSMNMAMGFDVLPYKFIKDSDFINVIDVHQIKDSGCSVRCIRD